MIIALTSKVDELLVSQCVLLGNPQDTIGHWLPYNMIVDWITFVSLSKLQGSHSLTTQSSQTNPTYPKIGTNTEFYSNATVKLLGYSQATLETQNYSKQKYRTTYD